MKTKYLISFFFLILSLNFYAQNRPQLSTQGLKPKILSVAKNKKTSSSPLTRLLLTDYENLNKSKKGINEQPLDFFRKYNISKGTLDYFVSGILKVSKDFDENQLVSLKTEIGTKAGNIWTFRAPLSFLKKISQTEGVEYLQIDEPVNSKLDNARNATFVNLVHQGYQLPQKYFGKNVVVGVIDGGFDYTHPMFYDSTYSSYRIRKVWEQNTTGVPPGGYSYGNEITGTSNILSKKYDYNNRSHGTHVAGIAAGGGGTGLNKKYKGVASASDIVLVSYMLDNNQNVTTSQSYIIDGINYIFNHASSVGKPAVVNMSQGTHIGPHNGTSLFDIACDNLVGPGKILVGAAGNEGNRPLHIGYTFTQTDTLFLTFVEFEDENKAGRIDIWGAPGKDFGIAVALFDPITQKVSSETNYWFPSQDTSLRRYLKNSKGDTCLVNLATSPSEFNNQPRVYLEIENRSDDYVILSGYGSGSTGGKINIWNNGLGSGAAFSNKGKSWAISGDKNSTNGEIGGTGKNIISVGAFTSKNSYTDYEGHGHIKNYTKFEIAPYSSIGPTIDGRIKPDITAPGEVVVSSVNSFDSEYISTSESVVSGLTDGTKKWWFVS